MDRRSRIDAERRLRQASALGAFTPGMAIEAGFTPGTLRYGIADGRWVPLAGTAYLFAELAGPGGPDVRQRAAGAGLTWPGGTVALRTAAVLHGFPVADDRSVHMIVPRRRRRVRGMTPHFLALEPHERMRMLSFDVTTPERTAIDCLSLLQPREADRLLPWVITREIVTPEGLMRATEARRRRHGNRQLRAIAQSVSSGAVSAMEHRLHALLREGDLAGWLANAPIVVAGRIIANVDILFPAERVVIEADGRHAHQDFERERARLNALQLAGYTVLRLTWQAIVDRPGETLAQVVQALQARRRAA